MVDIPSPGARPPPRRTAGDPDTVLLDFLQSAYEAAGRMRYVVCVRQEAE